MQHMTIKNHIPNFITLLNLLSGCIAIVFIFNNQLVIAAYLIGLAAVFDFLDGMFARLLQVQSPIGKDLDSLADVVSFGLVPGLILFKLLGYSIGVSIQTGIITLVPYIAFIVPLFSALRLAKFNNDERQTDVFIGLPTPANALLIASFPLIIIQQSTLVGIDILSIQSFFLSTVFLISITILLSYLLVAEIPLLSLKFKTFNWKDNKIRYLFLGFSCFLLILLYFAAVPLIILMYILFSLFSLNSKISRGIPSAKNRKS
jgi:CDP-diacylglycerol---serine O-phosphatidyltransferase